MSLRKRLLSCIESHDSSKVPRMEGHPNVAAYYTAAAGCYPAISQLLNHNISATISPVLTTSTISHAPNNFIERRSTQLVGTQHNAYPVYVHCQKEALSLKHKQDSSQFPLAFGFADQCNQSSVGLDTGQVCGVFPSCSIASKETTVPLVTTCSGGVLLATQAPLQSGFGKTTATFTDPARMFQNFQNVDFPKMFSMHPSSVANLAPHMVLGSVKNTVVNLPPIQSTSFSRKYPMHYPYQNSPAFSNSLPNTQEDTRALYLDKSRPYDHHTNMGSSLACSPALSSSQQDYREKHISARPLEKPPKLVHVQYSDRSPEVSNSVIKQRSVRHQSRVHSVNSLLACSREKHLKGEVLPKVEADHAHWPPRSSTVQSQAIVRNRDPNVPKKTSSSSFSEQQQPHTQSFCQSTRDAPEQLLIHPMNNSPTTAVPRTVCQDASLPRIKWAWSDSAVSNCGPYANLPVISRVYSWGAVQNTESHVEEKQVDGNKLSHAHPTKEHPNIMFGHVLQQPQSGTRPGVKDIVQGSVRSTKHASTSSTGPVIRDVFSLSPELVSPVTTDARSTSNRLFTSCGENEAKTRDRHREDQEQRARSKHQEEHRKAKSQQTDKCGAQQKVSSILEFEKTVKKMTEQITSPEIQTTALNSKKSQASDVAVKKPERDQSESMRSDGSPLSKTLNRIMSSFVTESTAERTSCQMPCALNSLPPKRRKEWIINTHAACMEKDYGNVQHPVQQEAYQKNEKHSFGNGKSPVNNPPTTLSLHSLKQEVSPPGHLTSPTSMSAGPVAKKEMTVSRTVGLKEYANVELVIPPINESVKYSAKHESCKKHFSDKQLFQPPYKHLGQSAKLAGAEVATSSVSMLLQSKKEEPGIANVSVRKNSVIDHCVVEKMDHNNSSLHTHVPHFQTVLVSNLDHQLCGQNTEQNELPVDLTVEKIGKREILDLSKLKSCKEYVLRSSEKELDYECAEKTEKECMRDNVPEQSSGDVHLEDVVPRTCPQKEGPRTALEKRSDKVLPNELECSESALSIKSKASVNIERCSPDSSTNVDMVSAYNQAGGGNSQLSVDSKPEGHLHKHLLNLHQLLSEMVEKSAASSSHNLQQAFQHLRHGPKRGPTVSHVSESKPTGEASYVTKHGGGGGGGTKRGSNSHSVAQTSSRSAEIHEHASSTTKEMFLKNISIQTRLEEFARELQTLVSKSLCPFPSVARLERIFIPVSALQEKLFPGLSELVILNVFKCCKVVLRPATLREEKMLGAVCCSENTQETGSFTLFPFDKLKEVYPELLYCCWLEKMKKCIDQNNEATEMEKNPVDSTGNGEGEHAAEVTIELCERVCSSQDSHQAARGATSKAQCLVENPQPSPAGAEEEPSVGEAVGGDITESAVVTNDSHPCEQTGPPDDNAERSRGAAVDSARSGSDANLECTSLIAPSPREDPHSTTTDVSSDSAATYPVISSSDVKDAANVLLASPPRYQPEDPGTIQHSADDAHCSITLESENTIEENNKPLEVKRSKYAHGVKQRVHKRYSPRLLKESVGTDKHQQASDTYLSKKEVCKLEEKVSKKRVPLLKLKGDMTSSIVMAKPEDESQASKVKLATTEHTLGHPVMKRKTVPPLIIRSHHQAHEVRTRLKSPLRIARKEKTFSTSGGQVENEAVDKQEREFEALEVVRNTEVPFEETAFDDVNPAIGSENKDQKHVRDPLTEEASPGCGQVKRPRLKHLRASAQVAEKKLKKQMPTLRRSLRQKTSGIQLRSQRGASSERRLVQVVPGKKTRCKRKSGRSETSPKLSRGRQRADGNADGGRREEPPSEKKTGGDLYPDLVGRRVLHLYDDEDTERWYQGVVTQLYEEHDDPLEAIYVVTYDSEPGWQYYLELLQDYQKGWLKLVD
ncbi:uncharacterized protein LOC116942179 [Petromyzon marinus]|uniref:uncharacterized protein LOC116942179 n=1 Tax=Petromyzon marinus TaxID=7757 RepID=UPI003F71E63C